MFFKISSHGSNYEPWLVSIADRYSSLYRSATEKCLGRNYIRPRHNINNTTCFIYCYTYLTEFVARNVIIPGCELGSCGSAATEYCRSRSTLEYSGRNYIRPEYSTNTLLKTLIVYGIVTEPAGSECLIPSRRLVSIPSVDS